MNADNLAELLRNARKKDEDARLLQQGDEIYLESAALPAPSPSNSPPDGGEFESILEETAFAPMPDIHVQTLYYTFLGHHLILLTIALFSFPIYYFSPSMHVAILVLLPFACVCNVICFITMQWIVKENIKVAMALLAGWVVCWIVIVGCTSNLLQNTAPIQLVLMLFAETVAMIAYCKLSPRSIQTFSAACYMTGAALLVWAVGIASFIYQGDWPSAVVILGLACLFTAHHVFAISMHSSHAYNTSWQDSLVAVVRFYKFWPECSE